MDPDNIPIKIWKCLENKGIVWFIKLFNEILRSKRMSNDWRNNTLIPIYKNKWDIQNYENYWGIKLINYTIKRWERVIEQRLRNETISFTELDGNIPK